MDHEIKSTWRGDMSFDTEINGHHLIVDADEAVGGKNAGPRPKPFLIAALTGCTGMDVASLIKKMRIECDHFYISAGGNLTKEHPKVYTNIELVYHAKVKSEDREKFEKAVTLSQDTYCGVNAMLKKVCDMSYRIEYID